MLKDLEFLLKKIFFNERYLYKRRLDRALKKNYEKELNIINQFSNKQRSAVDVGVYRGVYSYKLSKEFKHVYGYEANPLIYPNLKKNLNKIIKNLTLKNFAVSNTSGIAYLKIPKRSKSVFKDNYEELYQLGCASIHNENIFEDFDLIKAKKIKLDDDLKDKNIGFIKIDVEGHEKEVIEGSKNLIKKFKPILLVEIVERHTKKPVLNTINFIKQFGYTPFYVKGKNLYNLQKLNNLNKENNYIFIPK